MVVRYSWVRETLQGNLTCCFNLSIVCAYDVTNVAKQHKSRFSENILKHSNTLRCHILLFCSKTKKRRKTSRRPVPGIEDLNEMQEILINPPIVHTKNPAYETTAPRRPLSAQTQNSHVYEDVDVASGSDGYEKPVCTQGTNVFDENENPDYGASQTSSIFPQPYQPTLLKTPNFGNESDGAYRAYQTSSIYPERYQPSSKFPRDSASEHVYEDVE